jgi:glycosyltransferase involved in cell wall biosynthesis
MASHSKTHLVLMPSYNTGAKVYETTRNARRFWDPVWVVVDGSTDGTAQGLQTMAAADAGLRLFVLPENSGKGAAILHALRVAVAEGYTHVLTIDSDGQHPSEQIPALMKTSMDHPDALILGKPVFDETAPRIRVMGRQISNWCTNLETLWEGIGDSLYGLRVYPAGPLLEVMESYRWMRRFDFDVEAAVRLVWRGLRPINVPSPVRYFRPEEGGVSHFNYVRDNLLLSGMHLRLGAGFLMRLPVLLARKIRLWAMAN